MARGEPRPWSAAANCNRNDVGERLWEEMPGEGACEVGKSELLLGGPAPSVERLAPGWLLRKDEAHDVFAFRKHKAEPLEGR
jgi:hypothetical protein